MSITGKVARSAPSSPRNPCLTCAGTGLIQQPWHWLRRMKPLMTCEQCDGLGYVPFRPDLWSSPHDGPAPAPPSERQQRGAWRNLGG